MKPNAIIYIRVSSAEQVENFSLQTQEKACRQYCTANGFTVAQVFREEGESAKTTNRTQFKKMLEYCEDKKAQVSYLVVYSVSRFSRNTLDFHESIAVLGRSNIRVRSATEKIDETPEGFLMAGMMAVLADYDNRQRGKRSSDGMKAAIAAGRWTHAARLGYCIGPKGTGAKQPSLVHDSITAPLVRLAFELVSLGAVSQVKALAQLTSAGMRSKSGKPLTPQSLNNLLRNPSYAGRIVVKNLGENLEGDFEPIVSSELFETVQAILESKRPASHRRGDNGEFPLRVFVRCGACDTPITGSYSTGRNGKKYGHYACRKRSCRSVKVRREVLEDEFKNLLVRLRPKSNLVRLFREIVTDVWQQRQATNIAQAAAVDQKAAELDLKAEKLDEAFYYGTKPIDAETYNGMKSRLRQERLLVSMEKRQLESEGFNIEAVLGFAEHLLSNAVELWGPANWEQRSALQRVLFPEGIRYHGDGTGFSDQEVRTTTTNPMFKLLGEFEQDESKMASPRGFEPRFLP